MNSKGQINLKFYKCNKPNGNFGDEMSPIIVNKITNREIINSSGSNEKSLIAIGSYIQKAKNNDIIWGSGVRTVDQPIEYTNLIVKAVRGPITKRYLENLSIQVPDVFGDPGLLYAKLFDINKDLDYIDKIGFIPHYTSLDEYKNNKLSNINIISPVDKPDIVLSKIKSCKYIISSSLHGLIVADSYNIPNYWLYDKILNEGTLKFEDYFASQNRQLKMHNSIEDILKSNFEDYGNKINLHLLLNSFPKELIKKQ